MTLPGWLRRSNGSLEVFLSLERFCQLELDGNPRAGLPINAVVTRRPSLSSLCRYLLPNNQATPGHRLEMSRGER